MKIKINKKWNDREIAFLKKNYRKVLNKAIAKKLKRSRVAICHKAIRLGLKKDRTIPRKRLPLLAKKTQQSPCLANRISTRRWLPYYGLDNWDEN